MQQDPQYQQLQPPRQPHQNWPPRLKYRREHKHTISAADAMAVRSRMRPVLRADPNAGPDGTYLVRSLYFETPEDKNLQEKLAGTPLREKFRIRLYNHDPGFIRLEKKIKHFGMTAKRQGRLTANEVERILAGDVAFLEQSPQPLLRELYVKYRVERLRPKVIVDYSREAYAFAPGNVRVTLDSDVRTAVGSVDVLNSSLPTTPALGPNLVILEVKCGEFMPDLIYDLIQLNNCTTTAVSKYALCRKYL
ncbi:MAG: polyphosphate polymerase domain-containing protein [Bacillota bacterium]|nr:polyphosphate polymerase domain-containing protein [Bacillota bacterium]